MIPLYFVFLFYYSIFFSKCKEKEIAHYGRILTCAYGMAKAAIINLTHVCAQELGKYGIVTNCFLPVIANDYFENESNDAAIPVPIMQALSPVGKLGKAYADGSPLLAFLASEAAGVYQRPDQGLDHAGGGGSHHRKRQAAVWDRRVSRDRLRSGRKFSRFYLTADRE